MDCTRNAPAETLRPKGSHAGKPLPPSLAALVPFFRLMADPTRLTVFVALAQAGEMHVQALCDLLGLAQATLSHHLTLLRLAGLVASRREGQRKYYRLETDRLGYSLAQLFAELGDGRTLELGGFSLAYWPMGR